VTNLASAARVARGRRPVRQSTLCRRRSLLSHRPRFFPTAVHSPDQVNRALLRPFAGHTKDLSDECRTASQSRTRRTKRNLTRERPAHRRRGVSAHDPPWTSHGRHREAAGGRQQPSSSHFFHQKADVCWALHNGHTNSRPGVRRTAAISGLDPRRQPGVAGRGLGSLAGAACSSGAHDGQGRPAMPPCAPRHARRYIAQACR